MSNAAKKGHPAYSISSQIVAVCVAHQKYNFSQNKTQIFKQYFILLVMALRNDQFRFEKYNLWPGCPVAFVTKSLRSVATPRRPVLSSE